MNSGYKIFDAHTHAFPKKISERTMRTISRIAGIPHHHDGSFKSLLDYEQNGGSDGFLILPIATKPSSAASINKWVASKTGNGVHAFGTVHPACPDYGNELDLVVGLGLKGVKLHPEYQEFFVDDYNLFPLYKAIFDRGLTLYLHAGADLGYPPPFRGSARRIAKVCDAFPNARIVAAHMGGLFDFEDACEYLVGRENLWMDTSFAAERMSADDLLKIVNLHGADKILFGSDAPWASFETAKNAVLHCGLDDESLKRIFYENAMELLKIK